MMRDCECHHISKDTISVYDTAGAYWVVKVSVRLFLPVLDGW
jgi:hypothetical protein